MKKIAIVQAPPAFLDLEKTLERALTYVEQAVSQGAALIAFPEAFLPGYPAWIWRLRPGGDWGLNEKLHARLFEHSVDIERGDLAPLCDAARQHGVTILCGVNERDNKLSRTTLYNSYVTIGTDGHIQNRHRKLMPTNPERMVWGFGDGSGLKAVDTPCGRIGSLICWENYMPLARYALYAQGLEIYFAPTYDSGDDWVDTLRHIAREARCWVVGSGSLLRGIDMLLDIEDANALYSDPDEWVNPGDSVVITPTGEITAGPMHKKQGVLYADIDLSLIPSARRPLDVSGHYSRPDIFQLSVNREAQSPVIFRQ